jgi:hypothetical protein
MTNATTARQLRGGLKPQREARLRRRAALDVKTSALDAKCGPEIAQSPLTISRHSKAKIMSNIQVPT